MQHFTDNTPLVKGHPPPGPEGGGSAQAMPFDGETLGPQIIAHLQAGVAVLDLGLRYRVWNRYMETLSGLPASAVLGRHPGEVFPWMRDAGIVAGLERCLAGQWIRQPDTRFVPIAQDRETWVAGWSVPLRDGQGRIAGVLNCVQDVTERRRIETRLNEQAGQLHTADRRKHEFLAMLAHELRNPLAPIRHAVDILRRTEADPALAARYREVIGHQVEHLARLVDDLLEMSRLDLGKIGLRKARVAVADIVARAMETSAPLIEARHHTLSVELPAEPLWVEGDPLRLAQAVANLLDNAARYTDAGGHLGLGVEALGDQVSIRVRDSGRGIDPTLLPELFELFFQAGRGLDRTEGGLGLGLSLARRLVEMHGGKLRAFSAGPGRGSEFVISLPRRAAPAIPSGAPPRPEATPRHLRLLVVDDNHDAAESLALLLRLDGHEVLLAHDGAQAVPLALAENPEAVLLDIGLPGLDGYEACRRMRAGGLKDTLIVAVTGYGQEEDRRRSREAGFDAHLVKPVDQAAIQPLLAARGAVG
ncbi:hybrid sensor histidine kinase/response regulator [Methylomagnum ishizawai]|uniref:hybrid sensor histidine kinase/response regulator n=1 Tax=Methylomagnum ishizawai TaxID=1760988 RepID=UPI001C33C9BE|nr:ATP-binding protein [Methylomagnum ishizawai]BBL76697.1 hypothetical protein MishRS11D_37950 [Methylomagnum ishizawai]